jgi:HlyD family secretion protein
MKRFFFWMIVLGMLVGAGTAGHSYFYASTNTAAKYRTKAVRRGDIQVVVNSTGTVKPVRSVEVGSNVSGPILTVHVDYNAKVKAGQLLAQIDPRIYKAALAHEEAALVRSRADLARIKALLAQAVRLEKRGLLLKPKNAISETDLDQCTTDRQSLEAQVDLAAAAIQECEANLATAKTNLDFTDIKSPVDGIVIDRKVDPGQTLASQFQTPVMFIVAPDLESKVYVYASVDEADIGLIRDAQKRGEPVSFTVDAYPRDAFRGKIAQVRLNPTTVQNVVTYTVVVESSNVDLKLLPGMTANLSFQIEKRPGVLTVPNAALRLHPTAEQVRACDRAIVEGTAGDDSAEAGTKTVASATPGRNHKQRYVWIAEGNLLAAVAVVTGLSDKSSTELLSGELTEGQEVIVGTKTSAAKTSSSPPPPP